MQIEKRLLLGILILLMLANNISIASSPEDLTQSHQYKMMKGLQAMFAQMEPPLFDLGKQFNVTNSPVYLEYSDDILFRPDSRDPDPIRRKGFKIFTHTTDKPAAEVGYLIVGSTHHPQFSEPTIDLAWLFVNEAERGNHYGSNAVRIFEGIFKHHTDKIANVSIFSAMTNKENEKMCYILEKSGWIKVDGAQPNMVAFIKERPKKLINIGKPPAKPE